MWLKDKIHISSRIITVLLSVCLCCVSPHAFWFVQNDCFEKKKTNHPTNWKNIYSYTLALRSSSSLPLFHMVWFGFVMFSEIAINQPLIHKLFLFLFCFSRFYFQFPTPSLLGDSIYERSVRGEDEIGIKNLQLLKIKKQIEVFG